jgi:hypothetical protein
MANNRILGQECAIIILQDGDILAKIDTISSAEIEFEMELIEEGYLGEKSNRVDSVFNTMRVKIEGRCNSQAYITLADSIVARAQRRDGAPIRIDIVGSFRFDNGDFPSICIPDVHFQGIPFNIGARNEHVSFSLEGKASGYVIS